VDLFQYSLCFSSLFVQTKVEEIQSGNSICFSLWWIKDAPNLDTPEGIKEAPKFIDKYISTEIPTEDELMCKRVSALQRHNHTKTCRKYCHKNK
jgi:hypothetical protein